MGASGKSVATNDVADSSIAPSGLAPIYRPPSANEPSAIEDTPQGLPQPVITVPPVQIAGRPPPYPVQNEPNEGMKASKKKVRPKGRK